MSCSSTPPKTMIVTNSNSLFSTLPLELHIAITEHLPLWDIHSLRETSTRFATLYHPLSHPRYFHLLARESEAKRLDYRLQVWRRFAKPLDDRLHWRPFTVHPGIPCSVVPAYVALRGKEWITRFLKAKEEVVHSARKGFVVAFAKGTDPAPWDEERKGQFWCEVVAGCILLFDTDRGGVAYDEHQRGRTRGEEKNAEILQNLKFLLELAPTVEEDDGHIRTVLDCKFQWWAALRPVLARTMHVESTRLLFQLGGLGFITNKARVLPHLWLYGNGQYAPSLLEEACKVGAVGFVQFVVEAAGNDTSTALMYTAMLPPRIKAINRDVVYDLDRSDDIARVRAADSFGGLGKRIEMACLLKLESGGIGYYNTVRENNIEEYEEWETVLEDFLVRKCKILRLLAPRGNAGENIMAQLLNESPFKYNMKLFDGAPKGWQREHGDVFIWMYLETLLKTILDFGIELNSVRLPIFRSYLYYPMRSVVPATESPVERVLKFGGGAGGTDHSQMDHRMFAFRVVKLLVAAGCEFDPNAYAVFGGKHEMSGYIEKWGEMWGDVCRICAATHSGYK